MDFETYRRRVARNIRRARWAAGLTQEEVAARGINLRFYAEIERGKRNPSLETLFNVARLLGTTVGALTDVTPTETAKARRALGDPRVQAPKKGRKPKPSRKPPKKRR